MAEDFLVSRRLECQLSLVFRPSVHENLKGSNGSILPVGRMEKPPFALA